ncbi:MAG: tetratricopeptide repeat protein [Thermodesulfobacteriota bacterium]
MRSVNQNQGAKARLIIAALFLAVCAAAAYAGSLGAPFVLDDNWNILDNPSIRSLWPPWQALTGSPDTGVAGRPLVNLSLAVNHALSGDNPAGYRALNIAIHAACGIVLFLLLRMLFSGSGGIGPPGLAVDAASFFAALCFLLHPIQTQAVTYVTQRLESLMALFYLSAFALAVAGMRSGNKGRKAAAVVCFLLGTASKEAVVTAPLAIFFYDALFLSGSPRKALRRSPGMYAGFAAGIAALLLLVAGGKTAHYAISQGPNFTPLRYALLQPQVILHYVTLFFWPSPLAFDYGWPQDALFGWPGWSPAAITAGVIGLGLALAWTVHGLLHTKLSAYAVFFYLLVLAPTSSVVPLFCVAALQRPYLANAALCGLLFGGGALLSLRAQERNSDRPRTRKAVAAGFVCLAAVLCLILGGLTRERNRSFRTALTLWRETTEIAPWNSRAQAAYAEALEKAGLLPQAMVRYELASELNPKDFVAANNLGLLYARQGKILRARALYERALSENPAYAPALTNMATVFLMQGRPAEALSYAEKGVLAKPHDPNARNTLGTVLAELGRTREAIGEFSQAISLNPGFAEAYANLGFAWLALGDFDKAKENAAKALAINPDIALARKTAGISWLALGNLEKARNDLLAAARLTPRDAVVYYNLGIADLKENRTPRAAAFFRKALSVNPAYGKARQALQALETGQ